LVYIIFRNVKNFKNGFFQRKKYIAKENIESSKICQNEKLINY